MRFLSICSGIEAASVAWNPLGWEAVGFSEIEPFPCAVLKHHYPTVPNYGDMTKFDQWPDMKIDLLCGGTPCQAFSVAGKRKGLDDARGNLTLTFCGIADRYNPEWIVWENVPGVLSSADNAFGCFLAELVGSDAPIVPTGGRWTNAGVVAGCKRTAAWRVIDAQYFGVAQRRRRVFVVASAGAGSPATVLFEPEGVPRHTPPSRGAGQGTAADAKAGVGTGSHWDDPSNAHPTLNQSAKGSGGIAASNQEVFSQRGGGLVPISIQANAIRPDEKSGCGGKGWNDENISYTLTSQDQHSVCTGVDVYNGVETGDLAATVTAASGASTTSGPKVMACRMTALGEYVDDETASTMKSRDYKDATDLVMQARAAVAFNDVSATLKGGSGERGWPDPSDGNGHSLVGTSKMQVRRLTPTECEALQGFPRNYTSIPWKGKPADDCPDGPRYKALGNSWAVPCARWIGERIMKEVEYLKEQGK